MLYGHASWQARQPMQRSSLCMVMPSAVLNMAFGSTGQASTHGALLQWLQSTGNVRYLVSGKVPVVS
jgi:hypothetical protein